MRVLVRRATGFGGTVEVPGDKSISHRALLFAALGETPLVLAHLAPVPTSASTAACLRALGVEGRPGAQADGFGCGAAGRSRAPVGPLGLRQQRHHRAPSLRPRGRRGRQRRRWTGTPPCAGRPMARVLEPLRAMGAQGRRHRFARRTSAPRSCFPAERSVGARTGSGCPAPR